MVLNPGPAGAMFAARAASGRGLCATDAAVRWKVVPTLVWMNAPGKWRAMARVAFRPVRWAGMITSGASCPSARTVPAMTVEQRPG
jgi:hypothetical protein